MGRYRRCGWLLACGVDVYRSVSLVRFSQLKTAVDKWYGMVSSRWEFENLTLDLDDSSQPISYTWTSTRPNMPM